MESKEGKSPQPTVIVPEGSLGYHVAPRTENSTPATGESTVTCFPASGIEGSMGKKKRGRPRKYGPDGAIARTISPMPVSSSAPPAILNFSGEKLAGVRAVGSENKPRNKAKVTPLSLGEWGTYSSGGNFTPHVIDVDTGEDITMKIISFSQEGPRAICIISAHGVISNVTLRQLDSSGGTLTYEGRFEILSLSGSFTPMDLGGAQTGRSGGMSVSLISPDGRVVGGLIAGLLIAASPVQVVIGSFLATNQSEPRKKKQKPMPELKPSTVTTGPNAKAHVPNMEQKIFPANDQKNSAAENSNAGSSSTLRANDWPPTENSNVRPSSTFQANNWATMPTAHESGKANTDINISFLGD